VQGERAGAGFRLPLGLALALIPAATLGLSACGGESQDAHEPSGNFKVEIVKATFPGDQKLAKRSTMVIAVKNVDKRTLPDVSVTVKSFNRRSTAANLADPNRPVFVVNKGPSGSETANEPTAALGPLAPGRTAVFKWNVTAVQAGTYRIHYEVSAGLFGKARAIDSRGQRPTGEFSGKISKAPPNSRVNFNNGRTVQGG
jgi:hypothetical protein